MSHPSTAARRRVGVGEVALDDLAAPGLELLLSLGPAREGADGQVRGAKRVHDLRADEAGSPGDQDHSDWKFFQ